MGEITTPDLWSLDADPAKLATHADGWETQAQKLRAAQRLVDDSADRVVEDKAWTGLTAKAYQDHRAKLTGQLGNCADLAQTVADALRTCADALRNGQELLTTERQSLSAIPATTSGSEVVFHPVDDAQSATVKTAIRVAKQIRDWVDDKLAMQAATFRSAGPSLDAYQRTWTARTLRVLDFNIEEGGDGNKLIPWQRGDHGYQGRMDELAQRLVNGKVDVATLQEIFKGDANKLPDELNKLAAPGEHWEVHFGEASSKVRDSGFIPHHKPFGNAVVVRTDDHLTTAGDQVTKIGEHDGGRSTTEVNLELQ